MEGYVIIALKSIAVYVFIVAAIRVFGKKEFAQLSVVDVVFILLISNSVQTAMVGEDTSLSGGLVAALALFAMNYVFKRISLGSESMSKVIDGEPVMLIYNGKVRPNALKEASISLEQLKAVVREHGVEEISDVNLAIFEVDGNISVLSDNYRNLTKRKRKGHRILGQNTA
ncbi:YetF domain-containing protein [Aquirufa sp. HETE-83D]|uniref:YetF domain-containing protein n=1 Tax=Aquirufa esocilacus TaxID=3096513 RepID=A0ABW6DIF7_9BACT